MKNQILSYLIILFIVIIPFKARGQTFEGNIDWEARVIHATGFGAPNPNVPRAAQRPGAERAAQIDALRKILETIEGMNITSETIVRDLMIESDVIKTKVEGVIRGFKIVDKRYLANGSVEVDVDLPIGGELSEELLVAESFSVMELPTSTKVSTEKYSGLIVDVRGLNVRPAMAPRILDRKGNVIYGTDYVSRDYAVDIGVVGYSKSLYDAENDSRTGSNPLLIKAIDKSGKFDADIVISNDDADKIQSSARRNNYLDECRVMFVVD